MATNPGNHRTVDIAEEERSEEKRSRQSQSAGEKKSHLNQFRPKQAVNLVHPGLMLKLFMLAQR